jgi:hypothetical protein
MFSVGTVCIFFLSSDPDSLVVGQVDVFDERICVERLLKREIEKEAAMLGLATVPVYGYDRTMYGWHTGTDRTVHIPSI